MTLICIDRSNEALMKKLENFFFLYNIDNSNSNAYKFCKKYNLTRWLNHFYFPDSTNKNFQHSLDGTDKNSIILAKNSNRWKHYLDYFLEPIFKNRNTLLNCFESQAKVINNIDTENSYDYLGL
jgi:hypothetical protein